MAKTILFGKDIKNPAITAIAVNSIQELNAIIDGYSALTRIPVEGLYVRIVGSAEVLKDGKRLKGHIRFLSFTQVKGEACINIALHGEIVPARLIGSFNVTAEEL